MLGQFLDEMNFFRHRPLTPGADAQRPKSAPAGVAHSHKRSYSFRKPKQPPPPNPYIVEQNGVHAMPPTPPAKDTYYESAQTPPASSEAQLSPPTSYFGRALSFRKSRRSPSQSRSRRAVQQSIPYQPVSSTPPEVEAQSPPLPPPEIREPVPAALASTPSPTEEPVNELSKLHPADAERITADGQPLLSKPMDLRRRTSRREKGAAFLTRALSYRGSPSGRARGHRRHPASMGDIGRSVSDSAVEQYEGYEGERWYNPELECAGSMAYIDGVIYDYSDYE